jgi:hypothetical protein
MLRMRAVHMHVADSIIVCIENCDFVLLLHHCGGHRTCTNGRRDKPGQHWLLGVG